MPPSKSLTFSFTADSVRRVPRALATLVGALLGGWLLAREVGAWPQAILAATAALGLVAIQLDVRSAWPRAVGPTVLAGGAVALASQLWIQGHTAAGWALVSVALASAVAGPREGSAGETAGRFGAATALFAVVIPSLVSVGAPTVVDVVIAGVVLGAVGWLLGAADVRLSANEPAAFEGPYRS